MSEKLTGVLERIVYQNEENHYTIGEFRGEGTKQPVTIVGNMPGAQCGETLSLDGEWTQHPVHGAQFKVSHFKAELPASIYGIRKYLGSGLIPHIGPKYAERIVDKFGEATLDVISDESGRLREVEGIGSKRAKLIKQAWDEQSALREVMVFLQTYGVSTALCLRLIRKYGNPAKSILQNDPYRVAREVPGIGFKTADRIARNLGFANESVERIDAGLLFALGELETEGHTAYPSKDLIEKTAELLEVLPELIKPRIDELLKTQALVSIPIAEDDSNTMLQLPPLAKAEERIAERIAAIGESKSSMPSIIVDKAVAWAQQQAGFDFAPEQAAGVVAALEHKVSVLTGGPGTGKTTILRALVEIVRAKKGRVMLAAPTGRAAQRMSESAGVTAKTIHRLLEWDPGAGGFVRNEDKPLRGDLVVVDEASMLDTRLAASLLRAVPEKAHLLLVGDVDQLPSVGAGNVLKDLIRFAKESQLQSFAVTRLQQIFRQGSRSGIVEVSHAILHNNASPPSPATSPDQMDPEADLHFILAPEPERCVGAVVRLCSNLLPRWYPWANPTMDIQVLAPLHKGQAGIGNLNHELQAALNPDGRGVTLGSQRFAIGDKVIQTRNNYDLGIFNGDLGRVTAINAESGTLAAEFDSGVVDFERGDMLDLSPAYAISIHKSQGSEFPIVVIPLLKQHFIMLQRNLIYTGITRGRKKVFLIGDPAAYAMAVRNSDSGHRVTDLLGKLKSSCRA